MPNAYVYPNEPGFKEDTTSLEAAEKLTRSGRAVKLRAMVFNYFWTGHEGSADQIAKFLGESILAVRPRVSELHVSGLIERTGRRDTNESGFSANIYRLATAEEGETN